jgi:hypothetical protein
MHASGHRYAWDPDLYGDGIPAKLPVALAEMASGRKSPVNPARAIRQTGAALVIVPGERNSQLTSLAGTMRRAGCDESAISAALLEHNRIQCRPPLDEVEVRRIAHSVARYPPIAHRREAQLSPALSSNALHGLPGDIVRAILPDTEAHVAALLANTLVMFGNAVGRVPHAIADGSRHGLNLNACLVGATSKGRKGTSQGRVRNLFGSVDPDWVAFCQASGLSSGEGLIYAVRDPSDVRDHEGKLRDPGVIDKRLLITEEEFASILKMLTREGNVLSPMLRQAWDSGTLRLLTKNNPLRATDAHISVISHVTRAELLKYMNETEYASGFANRFLWVHVERSKYLPDGGGDPDYGDIIPRLRQALEFGRQLAKSIERDEAARRLWHDRYPILSAEREGLLGAVLGRAEAQVLRLGALYAVMDCSQTVSVDHLRAALAFWQYAEDSATVIFGNASGDGAKDRILAAVRAAGASGLSRTEVSGAVGRHVPADRLDMILDSLVQSGQVGRHDVETGGRPQTIYTVPQVISLSSLNSPPKRAGDASPEGDLGSERGEESEESEERCDDTAEAHDGTPWKKVSA